MVNAVPTSWRREALLGFVINAAFSTLFFIGLFGRGNPLLAWGPPDRLAIDFIPQSLFVSLLSAAVPVLIARRQAIAMGHAVPTSSSVLVRAALFGVAGAALGAVIAWILSSLPLPTIAWSAALAVKLVYGGVLGALVSTTAVKTSLSQ